MIYLFRDKIEFGFEIIALKGTLNYECLVKYRNSAYKCMRFIEKNNKILNKGVATVLLKTFVFLLCHKIRIFSNYFTLSFTNET